MIKTAKAWDLRSFSSWIGLNVKKKEPLSCRFPRWGQERGSEEQGKGSGVFDDIDLRLANGFDHDAAAGARDIALAGIQDVILVTAGAGHPDDAVLAFDGHVVLAVVEAQDFAWAKEQFDFGGAGS